MAIVHISGEQVKLRKNSLRISDALGERATASFVVIDLHAEHRYQRGQHVHIWDDQGFLVFGGVIDTAEEQRISPESGLFHVIQCIDWHYLADKRIAAVGYEEMLAGDIVRDLVDQYLVDEGITTEIDPEEFYSLQPAFFADFGSDGPISTVQDGPIVRQMIVNYRPISEALDALAELAGCVWFIDARKRLWFCDRKTNVAPWVATSRDMRRGSVRVTQGNSKYRNRQYITDVLAITDPQAETLRGDGETRAFPLRYPIATVPTVEVSYNGGPWEPQTVGIRGVESGRQWYWSKGDAIISQDDSEAPLTENDRLLVTYRGQFNTVAISEDFHEVVQRQQIEGGTGLVEDVERAPQDITAEAAIQMANARLRAYGRMGRVLRFRTHRPGLKPGQLLTVDLPLHDLNSAEMMIESVTVSDDGPILWYDVVCAEGPRQGSWARFFTSLVESSARLDRVAVGEDRPVTIPVPMLGEWEWSETQTVDVFACPVPSTSLWPDEQLFPC